MAAYQDEKSVACIERYRHSVNIVNTRNDSAYDILFAEF
jgi:hypothetical protein